MMTLDQVIENHYPGAKWTIENGKITHWEHRKRCPSVEKLDSIIEKEQIRHSAKVKLAEALDAMVYDLGDGRLIQVRPKDEQNIRLKIEVIKNGGNRKLIAADNSIIEVTVGELKRAMSYASHQSAKHWDDYMEVLGG